MARITRPGHRSHLVSTCVSTAQPTIGTSESTSPSSVLPTSIVCHLSLTASFRTRKRLMFSLAEWQWDQLRLMKVGGNESATKFFQQNGGSAALNSKDPKTKYQAGAATKYKEELKKRAARDAKEYVPQDHCDQPPCVHGPSLLTPFKVPRRSCHCGRRGCQRVQYSSRRAG